MPVRVFSAPADGAGRKSGAVHDGFVASVLITPRESMPQIVQTIMLAAPTTHFVMLAQAILYRGAGLDVIWRQFVVMFGIGAALFSYALARFRATIGTMV